MLWSTWGEKASPHTSASSFLKQPLKQWAEDVCFCLGVHAHHVAQGRACRFVAEGGPAAERVRSALARVADGGSYAAGFARRVLDAPPPPDGGFERVARLALWSIINTPEHNRGTGSGPFTKRYLG